LACVLWDGVSKKRMGAVTVSTPMSAYLKLLQLQLHVEARILNEVAHRPIVSYVLKMNVNRQFGKYPTCTGGVGKKVPIYRLTSST